MRPTSGRRTAAGWPRAARPSGGARPSCASAICPTADLSVYYSGWKRQATLRRADGATLTLRAAEPLEHLILHAPGGCDFVCLEPVSHVADAVNLCARGWEGTGLRALAPGESVTFRMQWLIEVPR